MIPAIANAPNPLLAWMDAGRPSHHMPKPLAAWFGMMFERELMPLPKTITAQPAAPKPVRFKGLAHYIQRKAMSDVQVTPPHAGASFTRRDRTYTAPTTDSIAMPEADAVAAVSHGWSIVAGWYAPKEGVQDAIVLIPAALAAPVDAVAASQTLTSDNTNVADGAIVTVGGVAYTFKDALTPTEGEVLIGADADGSLLNLIRAINHTGTPGTDYSVAAANPLVSAAASVTSHHFIATALTKGVAGNLIASTETSGHLAWGAALLAGGIDGTPGSANQVVSYAGQPYVCQSDATIVTAGAWKKMTVAAL